MALEMLTKDKINVREKVDSWEMAIREAAQPLLNQGYFNASYVDAMIESVYKYGPYIVVAPDIAIAHARPNGHVHKVGISLLKLREPIDFGQESHFARLIFVLSAVDNHSHIEVLQDLAKVLSDTHTVQQLIQSQHVDEMTTIIKEVE